MGELSPWHWIVVLLIFALLFGSKKLPDAARGLGRSLRIFRAEMQSARDEAPDSPAGTAGATTTASDAAPAAFPVQDAVPPQPAGAVPIVDPTAAPVATPAAAVAAEPVHPATVE